jgi:hypothetical protein
MNIGKLTINVLAAIFMLVSENTIAETNKYLVSAMPEEFLIRKGGMIPLVVKVDSNNKGFITDKSGNSDVCMKGCLHDSDMEFSIYVKPKREGEIQLGPYTISLGSELITLNSVRVVVLPDVGKVPGIHIVGASDPNGSGKYQVLIDYLSSPSIIIDQPVAIKEDIFSNCGEGLFRHSSSSGGTSNRGSAEYILENTTDKPIRLSPNDYIGLPENYEVPTLIIPPSKNKKLKGKLACC